jgi:hypothetical protein
MALPRTLNVSTGKESTRQTGFRDAAWGKATRGYATSARGFPKKKFNAIIEEARVYVKPIRRNRTTVATETTVVDDDERAHFVCNSGSESGVECKSSFFPFFGLTDVILQNMSCAIACAHAPFSCFIFIVTFLSYPLPQ